MKDYIFIDQDLDVLKAECSGSKSAVYKRLINHCESYFGQILPEEHPAASTTYMGIAMANLSLAWLLSGDEKYLTEARRWLFSCVSYPHWGNAHLVDVDLSAAWILFGMGITYSWVKGELSDAERALVKEKMLLQGRRMYDFKIETEGEGWSTNFWQNHNWINMTGLASTAYALVDEEPSVQDWIAEAKKNFDIVYSVMPEDGSDYEGVVYWRYGAMWLFIYAHLLKEREGIDYFKTCGFLKNTFSYRLYQAAPNLEEQINFGDAHDRRSGHSTAIYYKTAAEYRNGHAQKMGNLVRDEFLISEAEGSKVKPGILPECFFEVLFFDSTVEEEEFTTLPLNKYFEDLGLFVIRSSWDRDATHFSFKCSRPGGRKQWDLLWKFKREMNYNCFGLSHQHPDNNSFILNHGGEFFAIDDGYNRNVKASDHNTVLVDGRGYVDEGRNNIWKNYTPEMYGDVVACTREEGFTHVCGETASVYQKDLELQHFFRHFIHTGSSWYFLVDELKSALPHKYTWQMYGDIHPEASSRGYHYRINSAALGVYQFSEVPLLPEYTENTVRAVMTTQEPDKFTETTMKGLTFTNKEAVPELSFITVFAPGDPERIKEGIRAIEIPGGYGAALPGDSGGAEEHILYSRSGNITYLDKNINAVLLLCRVRDNQVISLRKII